MCHMRAACCIYLDLQENLPVLVYSLANLWMETRVIKELHVTEVQTREKYVLGWEQIWDHRRCRFPCEMHIPHPVWSVAALFVNETFFFFLMCLFFRHPASCWLWRYTGCLLSFPLKESLSPADLVSLWNPGELGKNDCSTNKSRRKNRPPMCQTTEKDEVKINQ